MAAMDGFEDRQHAWEAGYERTWDLVQEDQEGNIVTVQADQERARRLKASRITQSIRRGLIRYLYVAVDTSISMKATDMRPTRLAVVREALQGFVRQFFDENPLGQLGLLRTYDRKAEALTDLSGNPKAHVDKLAKLTDVQGLPSLQNILELACVRLQHIPDYGQRELLIVYGSLSTTDPGDIFETIARVKAMRIRVSVICVAAELHIAHKVAEETNGTFAVSLDAVHLRELISGFVSPPPALESEATAFAELVRIGFPARKHFDVPIFTYDGDAITTSSVVYVCPKCHSRVTELPTQCPVCGLQLNSSPHIARSYHHLFPVENFDECTGETDESTACYSCHTPYQDATSLRYRCNKCTHTFCLDCDMFIHDHLHNCPGCV